MIAHTRLQGTRFDSRLQKFSDADWALTLTMRIFLSQRNVKEIERKGKTHACNPWLLSEWMSFQRNFKRLVERIWNGKLWLKPPTEFADFDFPSNKPSRRPNVACRLEVEVATSSGNAHHTMSVVRLANVDDEMRSHSRLLDNHDLRVAAMDDVYIHVTAAHEVGHLLRLYHPGDNFYCQIDPNDAICYSDYSIMGKGISIDERHAEPWSERIALHTNTNAADWQPIKRAEPAASLIAGWY